MLSLPLQNTYLATSLGAIGSVMTQRVLAPSSTGGFLVVPTQIPQDWPLDSGVRVRFIVASRANSLLPTAGIRWEVVATRIRDAVAPVDATTLHTQAVPPAWQQDRPETVVLDLDGSFTVRPGDAIQLRLARIGGDAADTFDQSVGVAQYVQVEPTP